MHKWQISLLCIAALLIFSSAAQAHFGMIIPSKATVLNKKDAEISLTVAFAHPMEQNGMNMEKPKSVTVYVQGEKQDITDTFKEIQFLKHRAWKTTYTFKKPGVYNFVVDPAPYFEPAEDCYIVHYTKLCIPTFGDEETWDTPLGLKTEIVPLTRPFGNYAGNVFQGKVLLDGKPCAECDVEVEYYNHDGKRSAPNDYYVTQVVKTDANGVFTYAVPWAGWWGFAALNTSEGTMDYKGEAKKIELGAVLWTNFASGK